MRRHSLLLGSFGALALVACADTGSNGGPGARQVADSGASLDGGFAIDATTASDGGLPMGTAPAARADTAYAFDPASKRLFMFFGDHAVPQRCSFPPSDFVDEVWSFDATTRRWAAVELSSGRKPQYRARAHAVWDAMGKRALMFGGRFRSGTSGDYDLLNDLWAFAPATGKWSLLTARDPAGNPMTRTNFALASDGKRLLLHGGSVARNGRQSGVSLNCASDTWAFDFTTNTWRELATQVTPPPIRCYHAMAVDRTRNRLYVFGGGGNSAFQGPFYNDLWVLDLMSEEWTQLPRTGAWPKARIRPSLSYDAVRDRLVLFGGHDNGLGAPDIGVVNDLWTFDLATQTWSEERAGDQFRMSITMMCDPPVDFTQPDLMSPERRQSHLFAIDGDEGYLFGGKTDCGISNDTWVLDLTSFSWQQLNMSFRGMTCYRSGQDCSAATAKYCG